MYDVVEGRRITEKRKILAHASCILAADFTTLEQLHLSQSYGQYMKNKQTYYV